MMQESGMMMYPNDRFEVERRGALELPAPPGAPGEFLVRLGEGWGGTLHELADALAVWELGPGAAAGVLLSWCEFVAYEVEGREEGRGTMRRMQLLRGAVMAAGIEAAGAGRGGW